MFIHCSYTCSNERLSGFQNFWTCYNGHNISFYIHNALHPYIGSLSNNVHMHINIAYLWHFPNIPPLFYPQNSCQPPTTFAMASLLLLIHINQSSPKHFADNSIFICRSHQSSRNHPSSTGHPHLSPLTSALLSSTHNIIPRTQLKTP